jgi:hypothetical protein
VSVDYPISVYVALIYTAKVTGGKTFLSALQRMTERGERRTWAIKRKKPLTLIHTRHPGVKVIFALAGTKDFSTGMLGLRALPEPAAIATVSSGETSAQVLGFLVGMLAREAKGLGLVSTHIPLLGLSSPRA